MGQNMQLAEEIRKRRRHLGAAESELRGFHAPAPRAGEHAPDRDFPFPEGFADAARVSPPLIRQVALRRAVIQAHPRRVADARVGDGVADEDHLATMLEDLPELVIGMKAERQQQYDERENSHRLHSAA